MDWKETVTTLSENVFPGIGHKIDKTNYGNEVNANLPLQMAAYFNVVFLPVWVLMLILYLCYNYTGFNELYKFIVITVITTILVVEFLRLYMCYEGNLKDKIPELAGFWMLSLFLQLPLQSFLLFNPYLKMKVLELIVQGVIFSLLVVQIVSGYCALKFTAAQQATYFRIMKLTSDMSVSDVKNRYKIGNK